MSDAGKEVVPDVEEKPEVDSPPPPETELPQTQPQPDEGEQPEPPLVEPPLAAEEPPLEGRTTALESKVEMLAEQNAKLIELMSKLSAGSGGGGFPLVESPPPAERELEPELPPEPPEVEPEYPPPRSPMPKFSEFHRWVLADSLSVFNDKWNMRRAMERWVAFTSVRQRVREQLGAKLRGTQLIGSMAEMKVRWKAYHAWRMWLGLRRRHPKSFGLVPRALVYDPEQPEVGDVETIKERITYHTGEIEELSNVVRRHSEIVELLRTTLQKKLALEMDRLTKETKAMEEDATKWTSPLNSPEHPIIVPSPAPLVVPVLTHNKTPPQPPFAKPFQGYISTGGDLGPPRWMNIDDARLEATDNPLCMGFTYNLKHSTVDGRVLVYFKSKATVYTHAGGWCSYTRYNAVTEDIPEAPSHVMVDDDELVYSEEPYARSPQNIPPINPTTKDPSSVVEQLGLDPSMRRRLIDYYQYYNASKLPSVLHTMHEFEGHEEALFQALTEQYGPEPSATHQQLPEGWCLTESSKGDLFYRHVDGKKQWHAPV